MRLGIALRAFWAALVDRSKADQFEQVLRGQLAISGPVAEEARPQEKPAPQAPPPPRDPAVTLLAALQREARLVDLIREDLGQYSDAQVGAAARPCLQQCAGVLERWFAIRPLLDAAEGATVDVPADPSPTRYQWVGEGNASAGKLVHHGWQVTKVELPQWTGDDADAKVVAPAQVQVS
jgi:hypothetical protein